MKKIDKLLSDFHRLDVKLWINGDKLCYSAPKETLTPDLLTQLQERKAEIIKFLQKTDNASSSMGETIMPVSRDMNLPLSFAQQRMWFLNQIEGENAAYHLAGTIKITGALQVDVLEQSFREIIQRHEALRTTLKNLDGQPIQVISPTVTFTLPPIDLRGIPKAEREAEAQRLVIEEAQRLFDLVQGPLLRVTLLQLGDAEHLLLLVMHHIVSDGWSIGRVLFHELNLLYDAFSKGQASPLPELPIQYADFALWQRQYLQGETLNKELSYWKQQLDGAPTLLQLPTDRPRSPVQTFRGATQLFILPNTLTKALKALSQQTQSTLFMTLLAAFNTLLYRYTGAVDILVGSPIANRNRTEIEGLIGFFVNTLVLRTDLSSNPSFRELVKRVREVTLGAYAHQNLPFEKLVEELQIARDLSYPPLFQVMFILQNFNFPKTNLELPGLTLSPLERVDTKTAQFDLTLDLVETPSGLAGRVEYNTDLFDDSTITRMLGHFQTLLEGIVANPDQHLCDLPLLSAAEQHQLWEEWNQTAADYPKNACIHQLFEAQVERTPNAVAVVFEDEQLTYRELNQRANQLAHYLKTLGVKPEVLVGICLDRSIEMIVGLLGILKAGGAYVPLDPAYPQQRLALMMSDAQMPVLLTQKRLLSRLPSHQARVVCWDTDGQSISQESQDNPASSTTLDHLGYVIYTSGSTGKPKGVQIPHGAVVNFLTSMERQPGLTQTDVLLAVTSISFDIAALELYLPLITGARVALVSREVASDGKQLIEQLTTAGATVMQATPATWQMLLAAGWQGSPQLKILCGGEALPRDLAEQLLARGAAVWNLYGPTETTIWSTVCQVEAAKLVKATVPIGRPIANTQVYLLDTSGQPVPIGIPGELYIGGAGLARGYLNRPELTAQRFIHHPVAGRLYKTGDLARYLTDGTIEYIERIDHQVKLRGFRIELGEIETVLRQHPAVRQAVVMLREDEPGNQRLVAYLVAQSSQDELAQQLRRFVGERLPSYMIPSVLVTLEALPLTPNGKVDRKALPVPETTKASIQEAVVLPRHPVEEVLARIWSQLLGVEAVGIDRNFFELGGHSLLATQVISRIEKAFGVELPVRCLFESPTLATLSEVIQEAIKAEPSLKAPPIKPVSRNNELPLSFAQARLWFLDHLEGDNAFYNIPVALHLSGSLDVTVLEQSLNEIVRRHEALRTTFCEVDGQPIQVISRFSSFTLPVVDLRSGSFLAGESSPKTEWGTQVQRLAAEEACQPFDLANDPLLRVTLMQLDAEEYILLLTMHHIVSDGWSMSLLIQELAALYEAFSQGQPSPLPELPIQYADFAVWQRQYLQGEVLDKELSYWKQKLDNAPTLLQLPTDHPRPPAQTFRGATQLFVLPQKLTDALKALSTQAEATLFMTLLAAFNTLLYRYTGDVDILVGSPIANRNRAEIEPLIGFFVNTLVLRSDLAGNPNFRDLLKQVREITLDAYAHQNLPFEKLLEELQLARNLSHSPLFQVMFSLQNALNLNVEFAGLTASLSPLESKTAKFDLTLDLIETPSSLAGRVEYNTDLFDDSTITRMLGHFQTLLEGIVANPDQHLCDLPLLSAAEQHQLWEEWNQTAADYPKNACIHQLFEAQVERTPNAVAVVFEDEQLTYRELNQRANQLAHYLKTLGVKPEVLVGICLDRSIEMIVGLLGILKAGGAYVPLDPAYPQQRLALMMSDAQMPVLLTQKRLLSRLPSHQARVVCWDTDGQSISQESQDNPASSTTLDHLGYVIYTSGSTGKPKGVQIPHGAVVNFLTSMERQPGLTQTDVLLAVTSISFDIAALELYLPLITGARVALVSREVASDGKQLIEQLTTAGATVMQATPATWQMLLAAGWQGSPQLKILCGGEALPRDLAEQLLARGAAVWNLYGPTETTIWSTVCQVEAAKLVKATVPIGRPIANTQVYLLDTSGQPVPIGIPGELYIGGAGLARGYLNRPELTAQRFIHHPVAGRLYKTGDLARYLTDGTIEYIERIDHQVKLRGFRIELGEIETVLRQHPAVRQAVVMLREDEPGNQRLVAYLVAQSSQDELAQQLRRFVGERLPSYMIPSVLVTLEALPLTPNGKVDRKALPVPETTKASIQEAVVLPRHPVEEVLARIWSQLLGVEAVGIDRNFFELGGHSLLATQVISRIEKAFGVELPVRCLFESPTLAELAASVQKLMQSQSEQPVPPIERVSRDGLLPLSFSQYRLWLLEQLHSGSIAYNMATALHLVGSLNVAALEQALNEILRRHEALRTTFCVVDGQPIQVIAPSLTMKLSVRNLSEVAEAERVQKVQLLVKQWSQQLFDLTQGSLLRSMLLQLDQQEHLLVLSLHHIVADGWSAGVFFRELTTLYNAFSQGQLSPLPELPIQYADFAVWQRQWLQGEVLETQLTYWKRQLGTIPPVLTFSSDRTSSSTSSSTGKKHRFALSSALTEALKKLSQGEGVTLFMTLLAAFKTLLYRYSKQEDIAVGSPIANRNRQETEELIGFFVNTLVLRTDLSGNPSFRDVLRRVREVALGAYAHQDLPFEKLMAELQPERHLGHNPLFQVWFVLQNAPMPTVELPGLTLNLIEVETEVARYDLKLDLTETPEGLTGFFEYKTDLFEASAIARMVRLYETLLDTVIKQPDIPINSLVEDLENAEKQQQLIQEQEFKKARRKKLGNIRRKQIKR